MLAYMKDVLVEVNNNCHPFKNYIDYIWAKFLQASKMLKRSISMFLSNLNLTLIEKQLSYKNADKIRVSLRDLQYSKRMWWTKSFNIISVIANVTLKRYLIYYLDIIFAICFLISYQLFTLYMVYIPVKRYSTNNLDNNNIDCRKDK